MLEHLFGSKTRFKILRLFFLAPEEPLYVREITRSVKMQINAVRRELNNLVDMGILEVVEVDSANQKEKGGGKRQYYSFSKSCMIIGELKSLIAKMRAGGKDDIAKEITSRAGKVKVLLLTGYFVDDEKCETDMLIVGSVDQGKLKRIIASFEKENNQPIRYTVMSEKEFKERRQVTDRFLYGLFEGPRIEAVNTLLL